MEGKFKYRKVMIIGGTGLVGRAVLRRFYPISRRIFVIGLTRGEVEDTVKQYGKPKVEKHEVLGEYVRADKVSGFWGDIFLTVGLKDRPKWEILENENLRMQAIEEIVGFKDIRENYLYNLLVQLKPEVVVDTVNTATAVAYRDQFSAVRDVYEFLNRGRKDFEGLRERVEKLMISLYTPSLIRHFFALREGLRRAGSRIYLKVGTTGTGGMGWDIPYTHGEERPSRVLLAKTAMAGASSLLYVILSRANDSPIIKEIKPAAAIGWKRIEKGVVYKKGKPIEIRQPVKVSLDEKSIPLKESGKTGDVLETSFIDTGENGLFSLEEFRSITNLEQMEMITPEDIAETVMLEVEGKSTGKDVVGAIESSLLGPSYRGGWLRNEAIEYLERLSKNVRYPSVAFEILGPPRLSKLLFEAYILKCVYRNYENLIKEDALEISSKMWEYLQKNPDLLRYITSIGIGVVSPNNELLYTEELKVPRIPVENFSEREMDIWAREGWVDTRYDNAKLWRNRAAVYLDSISGKARNLIKDKGSSGYDRIGINVRNFKTNTEIIPGDIVAHIFIHEDKGRRSRPY